MADPTEVNFDELPPLPEGLSEVGGDLVVTLDGPGTDGAFQAPPMHGDNIADSLTKGQQTELIGKVCDWVEEDLEARKDWEKLLKDGAQTLGIMPLAADDAGFEGGSTVTHPLILEASVQFSSRAVEELFPSDGPVKCKTTPKAPPEIIEQGVRVEDFFNHYLTEMDEEYVDNSDQMVFLLSLHGHIFRKVFIDPIEGNPVARFVTASDLIVPYSATSLKDAPRYTHRFRMQLNDIKRAQASGYYRDVPIHEEHAPPSTGTIDDEDRKMADDADRRTDSSSEDVPQLYECHCDLTIEGDESGIAYPYIVTIEANSRTLLSVYRNWEEDDRRRIKQVWFASYKYLQGIGFYGLGLFHCLGNLAVSCGSMLRAILDAAALANLNGGFMAKQGGGKKGDMQLEMGVWKELEFTPEELSKAFFTPPFKGPDNHLMLILQALIEAGQRFSSTTETMVGDAKNTGPVGTTVALIEQGSKIFTAIHKRMHRALRAELKMLEKLFRKVQMAYPYPVEGADLQQDLDGRVDVIPVSDPTIVSSTQRIALAQATLQMVQGDPDVFDAAARKEAYRRLMSAMKVPNPDQILKPDEEQGPSDPVTENAEMLTGRPVKAWPEQLHDAHIAAHMAFAMALPPEGQAAIDGPLKAHIGEHLALKYMALATQYLQSVGLPSAQPGLPPELQNRIAAAVALTPVPPLMPPIPGMQQGQSPEGVPHGQ